MTASLLGRWLRIQIAHSVWTYIEPINGLTDIGSIVNPV